MSRAFNKAPKNPFSPDLHLFMITLLVISTSLAMAWRWQADAQMHERTEKQQIASELSFLKAQINPHFFFNTLNNIYALTYSDIPVSREAILKLSRMMRYVLYDMLSDVVLLGQELSFLKDYILLMDRRRQTPGAEPHQHICSTNTNSGTEREIWQCSAGIADASRADHPPDSPRYPDA